MKRRTTSRRLLAVLTAAAVLAVSACGSTDDDADDSSAGPVTVQTAAGPVTVDGTPERVVTIGSQWTDTVIALGVTPVAFYDGVNAAIKVRAPWLENRLGDARELSMDKDVVTQLADLDPDLILVESGYTVDAETLKKLKATEVPVVGSITDKQVDPWKDLVATAGTVLREETKAAEVTSSVEDRIATAKRDNPGLAGKTYTFAAYQSPTQMTVLADDNDGAASLFTELGLRFPTAQTDRARAEKAPRFQVSAENVQILDSDLLVIAAASPELEAALKALPGYANLTSVKSGAVAWLPFATIFGLNTPSALSLPHALDELAPALKAAA